MANEKEFSEKARDNEDKAHIELHHHPYRSPGLFEVAAEDRLRQLKSYLSQNSDVNFVQTKRLLTFAKQDYENAINTYQKEKKKIESFKYEKEKIYPLKMYEIKAGEKRIEKKLNSVKKTLEQLTIPKPNPNIRYKYAIISILSFVFALFFLSFNLTGFAISSNNPNDFRWLGSCFFLCGLTFTFIYLRNKNK
jgi:hypothetical protein